MSEQPIHIHPPEAKPSAYAEEGPPFHWREGWRFTARDDIGGVLIDHAKWHEFWLLIPRREWKSIVKAVAEANPLRRPDEDPEMFDALVAAKARQHDLEAALAAARAEIAALKSAAS